MTMLSIPFLVIYPLVILVTCKVWIAKFWNYQFLLHHRRISLVFDIVLWSMGWFRAEYLSLSI